MIAMPEEATVQQLDLEPGAHLRLTHEPTGFTVTLLAEPQPQKRCGHLLALPTRPYHRLTVATQKATPDVHFKHSKGAAAAHWDLLASPSQDDACEPSSSALPIVIRPLHHLVSDHYLTLGKDGGWQLSTTQCRWWLSRDCAPPSPCAVHEMPVPSISPPAGPSSSSSLVEAFAKDGYTVLHSLLPAVKVARALRYLNHHLGSADLADDLEPDGLGIEYVRKQGQFTGEVTHGDNGVHLHEDDGDSSGSGSVTAAPAPAGVVKLGKGHTCTCCLSQASMLLNLLDAQARRAIAHAVGETRPLSGRFGVQVALRFPLAPFGQGVADGDDALPAMLAAAGLDWHTDAAKYNDKKSFDVVVGVFLSDVLRPSDGALFVRPGSHVRERAARVEGRLDSRLHCAEADTSTQFSTADDCVVTSDGASSLARPILCEAGSVIVFDKDLLHAGGPNLAPGIRYALYARMRFEAQDHPHLLCDGEAELSGRGAPPCPPAL